VENFFSRFLKYSGDLSCYSHHEQNGSSLPFDLDEYPDRSIPPEGTREATRGGVNGSRIKFFCKNWPMSQVQIARPKPYKKVMNTPTNSIEMIT
jgi:hypothetical protein